MAVLLDDNIWYLRSWDANGVVIVKIYCSECMRILEVTHVSIVIAILVICLQILESTI